MISIIKASDAFSFSPQQLSVPPPQSEPAADGKLVWSRMADVFVRPSYVKPFQLYALR